MLADLEGSKGFLIDGYPREVEQAKQFEATVAPCRGMLYLRLSDDVMRERLLKRGKTSGRADDNEETIKKRLTTFHRRSEPVISAYKDLCVTVKFHIQNPC